MKKEKSCCFIQGAFSFSSEFEEEKHISEQLKGKIKEQIDYLIEKEGITEFFCGMEEGADLFYADYVLSKKNKNDLKLHCVIPFEEQASFYSEEDRDLYFSVAQRSDSETIINKKRVHGCKEKRDNFMLEKSDVVIFLFDMISPISCLNLQKIEKHKKIIVINPLNSSQNPSFKCI